MARFLRIVPLLFLSCLTAFGQTGISVYDRLQEQREAFPLERVYVNIEHIGNTSAASVGICLDELNRAGKLKTGDYILTTAFGGGLTWGAMLMRWT